MLCDASTGRGEGRVHQYKCRSDLCRQEVVNDLSIYTVRLQSKFAAEECVAPGIDFIADDARSECVRPDRQASRARGWFKYCVIRLNAEASRPQIGAHRRGFKLPQIRLFNRAVSRGWKTCGPGP